MEHSITVGFYDKFRCIADQCSFSCCKGWEISVDAATYIRWKEDKDSDYFIKHTKASKSKNKLSGITSIKMGVHKNCPFLNENELCNIVLNYGDDYLSKTCKSFPRLVNHYRNWSEYSLSCACPAVVDIIHNINGKVDYIDDFREGRLAQQSMEYQLRDAMIGIMENYTFTFKDRLLLIFYLLRDVKEEQEITKDIMKNYQEDNYLKSLVNRWKDLIIPMEASFQETLELFLDIAQNYSKEASYKELLQNIYHKAEDEEISPIQWKNFIERFELYDEFLVNCIVTKIFANGIMEDIDDILMSYQLILTEYIMIRFSTFLKSFTTTINVQDIRDYIVVYSRIIGYNTDGMKEFWEESFDEAVWDLSYLLLLIS